MALMNLYPPIVDTYMPAFLYTESCKIYFSLSPYNSFNDINIVQSKQHFWMAIYNIKTKEFKFELDEEYKLQKQI